MKYVEGVNRILRKQGIIQGDDDAITSFSSTQHVGAIELAKIAIQDEVDELATNNLLTFALTTSDSSFVTIVGTSVYALATNFLRFTEDKPCLYELDISTGNETGVIIPEQQGGVEQLRKQIPQHRNTDVTGSAISWYHYPKSGHNFIRIYPRADAVRQYRYWYVTTNTTPTDEDHLLPFTMERQARMFINVAARRFDIMFKSGPKEVSDVIQSDPVLLGQRASLIDALRYKTANKRRGRRFSA